jgi:hypothetical protein
VIKAGSKRGSEHVVVVSGYALSMVHTARPDRWPGQGVVGWSPQRQIRHVRDTEMDENATTMPRLRIPELVLNLAFCYLEEIEC